MFDAQGKDSTLALYFRKTAANSWDVYGASDGAQIGAGAVGTLNFLADGAIDTATTTLPFNLTVPVTGGGSVPMTLDLSDVTQFGSTFGVNELTQDGFTTGRLAGFAIGDDGTIMARYTNGQTQAQGRVALANFANPQGLAALGGNAWTETANSGQPLVGDPGSASLGNIQSGAVEGSNIDLTGELVSMITAQRSYQANAQTIRAQDQVLQTIVNLR